jgi:protein-disulfide isomerase
VIRNSSIVILATALAAVPIVSCAQPAPQAPTGSDHPEVVARIGEQTITAEELESLAGPSLLTLRQQMYETKMNVLESRIFEVLTEQAAEKAGQDRELWLQENLYNVIPEPEEGEIQKVLVQYRPRLDKDEAKARQQVVDYLNQVARQKAEADLRQKLTDEAGVEILLSPPRVKPKVTDASPSQGPADAPVVLIEYTDFQCPYCSRVQGTIEALRVRYGDSLRHVFKHLPLAMHQQARFAAEASMCANDQGGFWPMHDWLFANPKNISRETVVAQAEAQGLDVDALNACLDNGTHAPQVEADLEEARGFGITGTPGFLVNGRVLKGAQPVENFVKVINDELRRAGLPVPEPPADEEAVEEESEKIPQRPHTLDSDVQ